MPSLKRSASEAHLSEETPAAKYARSSIYNSDNETRVNANPRDRTLAEKWAEVLSDTFKPISDTFKPIGDFIGKSSGNLKEMLLQSSDKKTGELSKTASEISQTKTEPESPRPAATPSETYSGHSPTNINASSSSSPSTRRPPSVLDCITTLETNFFITPPPESIFFPSTTTLEPDCERMLQQLQETNGGIQKRYKRRPHILEAEHKRQTKEYLFRKLHELQQQFGYLSDTVALKSYISFRRKLEKLQKTDKYRLPNNHLQSQTETDDEIAYLRNAIENAQKSLNSPKPLMPYSPAMDNLDARCRKRTERIRSSLRPKRKPIPENLPLEAQKEIASLLSKHGVVSKSGREQVSDRDLWRLKPGQWLNDEIINFYGQLIMERSIQAVQAKENDRGKILDAYYMSSFFWTKLQSGYEKGRLAKWTKKVDIFSKDIVLLPVNHGNSHWTSAAINFKQKRFEAYDSMGSDCAHVFEALRSYVDAEHKNKKNKPFDFTGWVDRRIDTYPEQENGYDCGVFTCQTLESLSRGEEEFTFTQKDMAYFRQRMIWEIGRARLGDPL